MQNYPTLDTVDIDISYKETDVQDYFPYIEIGRAVPKNGNSVTVTVKARDIREDNDEWDVRIGIENDKILISGDFFERDFEKCGPYIFNLEEYIYKENWEFPITDPSGEIELNIGFLHNS